MARCDAARVRGYGFEFVDMDDGFDPRAVVRKNSARYGWTARPAAKVFQAVTRPARGPHLRIFAMEIARTALLLELATFAHNYASISRLRRGGYSGEKPGTIIVGESIGA